MQRRESVRGRRKESYLATQDELFNDDTKERKEEKRMKVKLKLIRTILHNITFEKERLHISGD